MNTRANRPTGKRALLVEGGGLRGAYAVGVLRALFEQGGSEQFDAIIAQSSGVFAATFFAAGQVEEMENTWRDLVHGRQLIDYRRLLRGEPILGLDYLIRLFKTTVRLDLDRVMKSHPSLWYVLTDYQTGSPVYLDAKCPEIFDLMRASAALPFVYPLPVIVGGRPYYDGGHSDAIPISWVLDHGFTEVVTVLTRPSGYVKAPNSTFSSRLCLRGAPAAREALRHLHERYNEALRIIETPPLGVEVTPIRPKRAMIGRLTRDRETIIAAIEAGKADGREYLAARAGKSSSFRSPLPRNSPLPS